MRPDPAHIASRSEAGKCRDSRRIESIAGTGGSATSRDDGEAVTRLPAEITEKYGEIPWGQIVGLRNRLIHGYDSVDLDVVEQILEKDLPDLIEKLQVVLD